MRLFKYNNGALYSDNNFSCGGKRYDSDCFYYINYKFEDIKLFRGSKSYHLNKYFL